MKFCSVCKNMLYIKIDEKNTNNINYYCAKCGTVDELLTAEGCCVMRTQLKKGVQKFNHIINRYTKLDPTLPRIYTMRCPNTICDTNVNRVERPEIIYMRYDDDNMKYLYLCVACDTTWKTDDSK